MWYIDRLDQGTSSSPVESPVSTQRGSDDAMSTTGSQSDEPEFVVKQRLDSYDIVSDENGVKVNGLEMMMKWWQENGFDAKPPGFCSPPATAGRRETVVLRDDDTYWFEERIYRSGLPVYLRRPAPLLKTKPETDSSDDEDRDNNVVDQDTDMDLGGSPDSDIDCECGDCAKARREGKLKIGHDRGDLDVLRLVRENRIDFIRRAEGYFWIYHFYMYIRDELPRVQYNHPTRFLNGTLPVVRAVIDQLPDWFHI
ncbi:hypothetical protein QBC43DRAFT_330805 [Cladorrhinum sp. PSN259]|nr:hypothetical protein QBC43DRAFT_330805 [Cladorrhinum sp. PSN259]